MKKDCILNERQKSTKGNWNGCHKSRGKIERVFSFQKNLMWLRFRKKTQWNKLEKVFLLNRPTASNTSDADLFFKFNIIKYIYDLVIILLVFILAHMFTYKLTLTRPSLKVLGPYQQNSDNSLKLLPLQRFLSLHSIDLPLTLLFSLYLYEHLLYTVLAKILKQTGMP